MYFIIDTISVIKNRSLSSHEYFQLFICFFRYNGLDYITLLTVFLWEYRL